MAGSVVVAVDRARQGHVPALSALAACTAATRPSVIAIARFRLPQPSGVPCREPELIDQVVVGERQLDPVEPALAAAPHGVPECPHQHRDLLGLELVRNLAVDPLRDLGRREEDVPALVVRLGPAAHVRQLGEDEAVVPMDGLGHRR